MSAFDVGSMMGLGSAAATSVASALAPKKNATSGIASADTSKAVEAKDTTPPASTTDTSGTITSSDFLTLLVSELKNQDPTQPTDPNAYITQLVGVNSLQQLISINSGLTSIETPTS